MLKRADPLADSFARIRVASRSSLHAEGVFKAFLVHERALAERQGQSVSVLAFRLPYDRARPLAIKRLGQTSAVCLRRVDVVGWMDVSTVGVMLPCTSADQAAAVGRKLDEQLAAHGGPLAYDIYTFPTEQPDAGHPAASPGVPTACSPFPGGAASPPAQPSRQVNLIPLDDLCVPPPPRWKRLSDIVLALLAIFVATPWMLAVALWIKSVAPGPVLFHQERVGYRGRRFLLYKFRSMHVVADAQVHQQHLEALMTTNARLTKLDHQDARLIPGGRVLRASGLDELPQLFNILCGDMSLIGPRPCVPYEYAMFRAWHKRRFHVYPGVTGLWQVSGKNATTFEEMMRLDNAYTLQPSFLQDLRILVKTVPVICEQVWETLNNNRK
jgi:lipopolysaccharide/colanic/teichoic acid biosynthesis glycosyltransferase